MQDSWITRAARRWLTPGDTEPIPTGRTAHRRLWIRFLAILVPLIVLLVLQYSWLADLERSSKIAKRASLENYLDAVAKDVHWHTVKISERSLNLPATIFTDDHLEKAAYHFKKKSVPGAHRLFIVDYGKRHTLYTYNPECVSMEEPEFDAELLAMWSAIAPWQILVKKKVKLKTTAISVDQRDPKHRILINPIIDEDSKLVGLAGMILDQRYYAETVIPNAIKAALPKDPGDMIVCVRDHEGRRIYPASSTHVGDRDMVKRNFSYVFTDWTIGLQGDKSEPSTWARANFIYNMTLSGLLAGVLLLGMGFTVSATLREMRLSAMKSDFVSNVSHELRTPLASVRVFGEFMRRGRVTSDEKIREYGAYIETESRRLTQLINNILDFSRIESGQKVYTFEPCDLEDVVATTLATLEIRLRNREMELEYEGPEDDLPTVMADANAIDRALANLLDNAVKYSNGSTTIAVRLRRDGDHALLSVTDHGIGIPRHEQGQIFERFHRVSTGLVHDVKGSGLGLSLVQHIVTAHGGWITVDSEVGRGSTFTIGLPLEDEDG
jgi:signal transduction histidine kinase